MDLKVLELFAGIGACSKALTRLGIGHTIVDAVEIDKYAIQSFNAIHGTSFEPQDITKWDKDIEVDLIMHGSPCQDFSLAGKQAGGDKGSGTRSSLMYETLRIVEKLRPKYVIWENVRNLLSKKHVHNFGAYLTRMRELGYVSSFKVLNAKDYGIPQNRERVFTVSIYLPEHANSSNDLHSLGVFDFPEPFQLDRRLGDLLEKNVDEKYYLTDKQVASFKADSDRQRALGRGFCFKPRELSDYATCISTRAGQRKTDNFVKEGVAIRTANKLGYDIATDGDGIDLAYPQSSTRRGRVGHGVAKTLSTSDSMGTLQGESIRKLTPLECWRLMGFDDADFEKAAKINSNTQLYKQAGNSIVVDVLYYIFKELLDGKDKSEGR